MKILLINPFGSNWIEGRADKVLNAVRMAPVGILSIAAYLMEKGLDVNILNCMGSVRHSGTGQIISHVLSYR
ncbi:MAG: hypothetical protein HY806_04440, partial [Nitrospirae bacterium]|nr:hypothetical protein [Nitrospirota bacterium]